MTVPTLSTPAWEFTPGQNLVLSRLAQRMRVVGLALMGLAVLLGLRAALGGGDMISLLAVQAAIVLAFTGYWSVRASAEFGRVATTAGADVAHLMAALTAIHRLYALQFWIFLVAALVLGGTLVMAVTSASWLLPAL